MRDSVPELTHWFSTPLGQALIAEEQRVLDDSMQCLFGYHLLQLGVSGRLDLTESSRILHRFVLHPHLESNSRLGALAEFNHLPLSEQTIDAVVLHHALDYSQSPHHLLREAARVVIPRGYLIIVGFNPWSLWGLCSNLARLYSGRVRWRHQYLRQGRLLDWLALLDMEPTDIYHGFYRPPVQQQSTLKHLHWMERWGKKLHFWGGGFYVIVARKDHIPLTPIKPAWKTSRPLRGLVVTRILGQVSRTHWSESPITIKSNMLEKS